MFTTLFLTTVAVVPTFVAFLQHSQTYICPWSPVPFFQISLKNSALKTTHNTFRDCRVHFFRQPSQKYLYRYKMPRFGGPVFSSVLSRKTNFSSSNSMSRIREGCLWRFLCNLYIYDLYKAPRLGGPVFSTWSALSKKTTFSSLNSTTRIREGRTWRFYCNLYIGNLTRFLRIKYI